VTRWIDVLVVCAVGLHGSTIKQPEVGQPVVNVVGKVKLCEFMEQ